MKYLGQISDDRLRDLKQEVGEESDLYLLISAIELLRQAMSLLGKSETYQVIYNLTSTVEELTIIFLRMDARMVMRSQDYEDWDDWNEAS